MKGYIMYPYFNEDAIASGVNLTGKVALPIEFTDGRLLMIDLINPVTQEVFINSGTTMDKQLIEWCQTIAIDYAIVYDGTHKRKSIIGNNE